MNANADIIDLRDLLVGYNATSNLSDFVTAAAEDTGISVIAALYRLATIKNATFNSPTIGVY
jgi:hypothetical protein